LLATKAGDVELRIPKLRKGSFFPSILEPRRRVDQALYAVVMEAYVQGISTRSVDDLVVALGADSGISKSEVSRICEQLDESVGAFRTRPLDHIVFPYVYLDATYLHVSGLAGAVQYARRWSRRVGSFQHNGQGSGRQQGRRRPGWKSLRGSTVMSHDPLVAGAAGTLLIKSPRWSRVSAGHPPRSRTSRVEGIREEPCISRVTTQDEATAANPASQSQTSCSKTHSAYQSDRASPTTPHRSP
jgi:hypothetical protein